ncbi:3'-5' DNA helicase, partial [Coemansia sp. RSA 2322]
ACKSMIRAILSKTHDPGQATQQIPRQANWIVEMNGSTPPKSRQALWSSARFVFSTPQILQNDLKLGTLDRDNARRITLLVIDEAHRATGKYAYGESISGLYSVFHGMGSPACDPMQPSKAAPFRVMALTATPGSNIEAVREIVQRLHVAHIFIRTEESLDVVPYMHGRRIEEVVVDLPPWLLAARDRLADVISRSINILCNVCHAMANPGDPRSISGFKIRLDRDRFLMRHQGGGDSGMDIPRILSEFTVAMSLAHIMQLLSEHGLRPAWTAINMWTTEVMRTKQRLGSASRAKVDCVDSKEWEVLFREFGSLIDTLDNKQSAVPGTGAAGFNVSTSSLVSSAHAPALSTVRTDVVSSFFGKSGQTSSLSTLAGRPQSLVELAPKGFLGHPKLERMVEIVRSHFGELGADDGSSKSTRIIIFSQYRGSVNEIVGVLDHLRPLVRCFRGGGRGGGGFRGRSGGSSMLSGGRAGDTDSDSMDIDGESIGGIADDASGRGLTQKEQLAVLARFRQGDTNIIVATCVGEEGLDIGEVDLIINYDAPSSPIRLLQRIGRTGRARRGKVVVFLAKGTREEDSYKKAQREYKSVQAKIASGNGLMLREDLSPPMLCPSLPPGAPLRVELHLTKDDIAVADASASNSKGSKCQATASGSRVRGGGKLGASAGIDNADMGTFRSLSLKYPT